VPAKSGLAPVPARITIAGSPAGLNIGISTTGAGCGGVPNAPGRSVGLTPGATGVLGLANGGGAAGKYVARLPTVGTDGTAKFLPHCAKKDGGPACSSQRMDKPPANSAGPPHPSAAGSNDGRIAAGGESADFISKFSGLPKNVCRSSTDSCNRPQCRALEPPAAANRAAHRIAADNRRM
jgi:hypothetical protein